MSSCSPGAMSRSFDLNGADPRMEIPLQRIRPNGTPAAGLLPAVVAAVPPRLSLVSCLLRLRLRRAPRPGDRRRSSGSSARAALGRQLDVQVGTRLCPEVVDVDRAAREAR